MESEQLITKITQTLKRPDGSEVRIVVEQAFGSGLTPSLGVYVLRRPTTANNWQLCKTAPHKDWRTMSVDEYQKHGRSEMLRYVSIGEILRLSAAIGKPMSYVDTCPGLHG